MMDTPLENGKRKASSSGSGVCGLRNRMVIPRFMKGVVKSTASSRSAVMVRSVTAKWMSCLAYNNNRLIVSQAKYTYTRGLSK